MKGSRLTTRLLSGLGGMCLLLALVAVPVAWADDLSDCDQGCAALYTLGTPEYDACVAANCFVQVGNGCANTCGPGVFPQCGTGTCDKDPARCTQHSCKLVSAGDYNACECSAKQKQ